MTRENQLVVNEREGYFFCSPCNRYFRSQNGALQHARTATVHRDEWCDRCDWLFVSPAALDSHLTNSRLHLVCEHCDEDVGDADDLDNHLATEHAQEYSDSESESESESNYSTDSDPRAYEQVHYHNDPQCYVCEREFNRISEMVQHIEHATCESGLNSDRIRNLALHIDRYGDFTDDRDRYYPFKCYRCGYSFRFVSSLLQHVESDSCDQEMNQYPIWGLLDRMQGHLGWRW